MHYGVTLNPNVDQYVVLCSGGNIKEVVGGVYKVKKNAEKRCAEFRHTVEAARQRLADASLQQPEAFSAIDADWAQRDYRVVKITYEEVTE